MSELQQALQIAAALPRLQREQIERVTALLTRMPIADLATLGDALEQTTMADGHLYERIMKVLDVHVRVAEWHLVHDPEINNDRCEHKNYNIGGTRKARIREIGAPDGWVEAWLA